MIACVGSADGGWVASRASSDRKGISQALSDRIDSNTSFNAQGATRSISNAVRGSVWPGDNKRVEVQPQLPVKIKS